ncbi:MFS transporter [Shinella yambaruensis]|uniref:MFS transporter n=1 Tax=Shinella yambaruensis TaxID=415996 RepID=A0ABQ5ZKQ7_9HYPH|nr:MFS transporter [Shinella yambaruensis]MCJ8027421.1 MFS transporter [Shinella yambaruensis]MCU7983304.1 MFS transporter [Shinella yambaruensis]GLR52362.1 MFS transporter [Shinella yambaruensis]
MAGNSIAVKASSGSNRLHCSLFFLAAGIGIGAWASSLPLLTAGVGLDKGQLGLVLLCFAFGAIVLMIAIGRYIDRVISSRILSLCGSLLFGASFLVIPLIDSPIALGAVVFVTGAAFGTLDVSMNTEASRAERETGRHMMSSFHALFSIGNLAGAFLVGQLIGHGGNLQVCLGAAGLLVMLLALSARMMARKAAHAVPGLSSEALPTRNASLDAAQRPLILLLGAIAFLALLAEGGMMDWTAIYMIDILGASDSHGAYAFAFFAAAMAGGRLVGDAVTRRVGHVALIRTGGLLCALSVAILLFADSVVLCLAALVLCGLGVANMVPAVFARAGNVGADAAGRAISIVTTMGYSGLLLGPALLGFLAQATSLVVSFGLITLAFLVIAAVTIRLDVRLKQHAAC